MIESYIWVYMNDSQWSALIRVTEVDGMYSVEASLGKITLLKKDDGFDLEYPSHSVSLYRDSSIPSTDRYYLHYMYNEWLSRNMYSKSSFHYSSI